MAMNLRNSELIINDDGAIYHLHLRPEHVAKHIITVGDPARVDALAKHLDSVSNSVQHREFKATTGMVGNQRLTIISTGIGTDNIDIVMNELDALVNIDFETRTIKPEHTKLNFYRIGTSGGLGDGVDVDSFVVSQYAIGLDGLLHFYKRNTNENEDSITEITRVALKEKLPNVNPYASEVAEELIARVPQNFIRGITVTADGFYGPQGRELRAQVQSDSLLMDLKNISYKGVPVTNFEMETAGIYGMARVLGHNAISLNAILANRNTGKFSNQPHKAITRLIEIFFEEILPS